MTREENNRIEQAAREAARAAAEDTLGEDEYENDSDIEDNDVVINHTENVENNTKKGNGVTGFICGALAVIVLAGGWQLIKKSKTGDVKTVPAPVPEATDTYVEEPVPGAPAYDYGDNELVVVTAEPVATPEPTPVATPEPTPVATPAPVASDQELTTDVFSDMVAAYANTYSAEYSNVSTEDITKFAVIGNIDLLAEENPELIREIAGDRTKEEFLNDAAKLIGATVMNNFNVWNSTHSTEGFIRVSNIVYGEQRDKMVKIEEYVDRIAAAANAEDADLVNQIVSEFIIDMNSGDLSKLDDGVGFIAQVNIAMISDGIARNYLNKENFDMLQILKTSEKYVSNIFTVYERCTEDTKTRSR